MFLVSYENELYKEEIEYALRLLLCTINCEYKILPYKMLGKENIANHDFIISYGKKMIRNLYQLPCIHIYESDFFGDGYLTRESLPKMPLKRYDNLVAIYEGDRPSVGYGRISNNHVETNIDIIASIFFMVTRYEEVVSEERDEFDRFTGKSSLAYREGFLDRPIVNEYVELLCSWIKELGGRKERKNIWGDHNFGFCLTHDVDLISLFRPRTICRTSIDLMVEKRIFDIFNLLDDYLKYLLGKLKDHYDTFDFIIKTNRDHNFKSTFYLMPNGNSRLNSDYTMEDDKIKHLVKIFDSEGYEMGLHLSLNSYNNKELTKKEKIMLENSVGKKIHGCRQHFLRFKSPISWRNQEYSSLLYDSSLGYADHIGFRCGICHPFKAFDILNKREMELWEVPLTVMDGTLRERQYMSLTPKEATEKVIACIETIKRFKGVFVLLWHNHCFNEYYWKGWKEVYETILDYIGQQRAKSMTVSEVIMKWENL